MQNITINAIFAGHMATTKTTKKAVKKAPAKEGAVTKPISKKAKSAAATNYAVITTGGKQYKVAVGDVLKIEKLPGEFKAGDKIVFDQVLLVDDGTKTEVGAPYLAGKKVESEFARAGRNKTIDVIKYKQKSRYFKKNGHRQHFIEVTITGIK